MLETGGEIASMLLPFSQEIVGPDGTAVPVWYVYAFCTHPDCRSRGFGQRLLAWTEERGTLLGKRGVVMVPGEESLFSFYRTLGYQTCFSTWEQVISRKTRRRCPKSPRVRWRSTASYGPGGFRAAGGCVTRAGAGPGRRRSAGDSGGGLYRVGDGVAAVERWGGEIAVKELLSRCPEQSAQALLAALVRERALVRTGPGSGAKPFGVVKWLDPAARTWWQGGDGGCLAFAYD